MHKAQVVYLVINILLFINILFVLYTKVMHFKADILCPSTAKF